MTKRKVTLTKKRNKITTQCLKSVVDFQHRKIYIAEQLTARKQYIFKVARDIKRAQIIKFAWAKNGEIFIMKTEKSRIIKVKTVD